MQLLTNELRQALPPLGAGDGDDIFFGVVDGFEVEYGYFSLSELAAYRGRYGAPIERDPSFTPKRLQEIYLELRGSRSLR